MSASPRGLPVKEVRKLSQLRRVMAQTMKASVEIAALSRIDRPIDLSAVQAVRANPQDDDRPRLSLNTWIMAAVARTLPAHPLLNAELVGNEIVVYDTVNLGAAVAVPDGLIVIVIPAAQTLSLVELDSAMSERMERARQGKLTLADVEGGTFTVSNLGMFGVDGGFPLPRPPEGAILLVGAARPTPWADAGQIVLRDIARFTLTFDHRFIDGAAAARFLADLNDLLNTPHILLNSPATSAP